MHHTDIRHFIVIDDDEISNHICRKGIEMRFRDAQIKTFTNPVAGLEYIFTIDLTVYRQKAVLFLDINMAELSGWNVLDRIVSNPEDIRSLIDIYILSSSIDPDDKRKAANNSFVRGFVEKPLTLLQVKKIFPLESM